MSAPETRLLGASDALAAWRIGAEAFGYARSTPPDPLPDPTRTGLVTVGAYDGEHLLAKAMAHPHETWWGGRRVRTAAVAGVAVRPEDRGRGLLTPVMDDLLGRCRERGDVVATLYPTAPGIYRRYGFETVAAYDQVELPTHELEAARAPARDGAPVALRRATDDAHAVTRALYDAWAAAQDGPNARTGSYFPRDERSYAEELGSCAVTVAEQDGRPTGYAVWRRTDGYHQGVVDVDEVLAATPEAGVALLRSLGSHRSVAPRTTLWTSGDDPLRLLLPGTTWRVVDHRPCMLAVLDVVGAFEARGYPASTRADLVFAVSGPGAARYRLRVEDGRAECTRTDVSATAEGRTLTPRGLALAWAGTTPSSTLRAAGLLAGPTDDDEAWDVLTGRRQVHVRDYF